MDISTDVLGLKFQNPFILASAPPTGTYDKIARAFDAGWAGAVIKTLICEPVINLQNRFATNKMHSGIIGFENLEQLSETKSEEWFKSIRKLKEKYPEKRIIGSIMGDATIYDNWKYLAYGCQEAGADMLELNFSCPNGYPDKDKGSAMGQNPEICNRIVRWLKEDNSIRIPIIAKLTAAVTDITTIGTAVSQAGVDAICAINTIPAFMGFNLKTLEPKASINGYTTYGGYSGPGIKPIALKSVSALIKNPGIPVISCGGISNGFDAAEFILLGSPAVQVATAVLIKGVGIVDEMKRELMEFMSWHNFKTLNDFMGLGNAKLVSYDNLDKSYSVKARVNTEKCHGCGVCFTSCRDSGTHAIEMREGKAFVNENKCMGCSLCFNVCPHNAIDMIKVN
jgi:dihydropyrimidine dehydrogenase (NAD+) subunit PreA